MSATRLVHGVGSPCSNRLIDPRGRNLGCVGRLVEQRHEEFAPGRYRPAVAGPIVMIVCPRCGAGYGKAKS